uniref:Uncharacterized protein n=1 Tax=Rhizophora mucronata TaxID=61149 RepID=A0A2P2N959_RHIMU
MRIKESANMIPQCSRLVIFKYFILSLCLELVSCKLLRIYS